MRRLTNVPRGRAAATQLAERYRFGGLGTDQPAGSVANGGMIHGSQRLERPWRRAAASPSGVACIVAECPRMQPRSSVAEPRPTSAPATTCCGSRPPTSAAGTGRRWRAMPTRGGRGSSRSTASWPITRPSGGLPSRPTATKLIGYARSIDRGGLFELTELFVRPGRPVEGRRAAAAGACLPSRSRRRSLDHRDHRRARHRSLLRRRHGRAIPLLHPHRAAARGREARRRDRRGGRHRSRRPGGDLRDRARSPRLPARDR